MVKECLAITPGNEIEVIVSDNDSSDNTEELLTAISDSRFHYYHAEKCPIDVNVLYVMAAGSGKWIMELTDKDSFEQLDWAYMREILSADNEAVIYKGVYVANDMTPLVNLPPKIFVPDKAETYGFLLGACSYASNTIIRRQILLEAIGKIEQNGVQETLVYKLYPHVCAFAYCLQHGTLNPLEKWIVRRQLPPISEKTLKAYNYLAQEKDEPYWTPFSRLEQHIGWIKLFRPLLSQREEQAQIIGSMMMGLLGIIVNYYGQIHADKITNMQHLLRPDAYERDKQRATGEWHNFFWYSYVMTAK